MQIIHYLLILLVPLVLFTLPWLPIFGCGMNLFDRLSARAIFKTYGVKEVNMVLAHMKEHDPTNTTLLFLEKYKKLKKL